jgi:hypothetical protein
MVNRKYIAKKSGMLFDHYIEFIVTALGLVAALSWNSAFQKYFEQNEYLKEKGPWIYAFGVTFFIFIIITILNYLKDRF